jgi:fructose-1,6-bisphosphatase/inositol monophosphatase family enzyme
MSDNMVPAAGYAGLLPSVVKAATAAGDRLMAEFSPFARPASRADMAAVGRHTEDLVLAELRPALASLRPAAGWADEDREATPLPPGELWVVDAVEGAVNYVHGMPEWGVTVTLMRDSQPALAVVRQPVGDLTYTAVRGAGAPSAPARPPRPAGCSSGPCSVPCTASWTTRSRRTPWCSALAAQSSTPAR